LAIKIDGVIQSLIEAKAINQELKDGFVKSLSGKLWKVKKPTKLARELQERPTER